MKKKSMLFKGLGFPIVLLNVPIKKIRGEEIVDINFKLLSDNVFKLLIEKPARFSGAEIKFIRHYVEKNQEGFATLIHVERSTISVWENKDLKVTGMDAHTEAFIRLKMAAYVGIRITRALLENRIEPAISQEELGKPIELKAA